MSSTFKRCFICLSCFKPLSPPLFWEFIHIKLNGSPFTTFQARFVKIQCKKGCFVLNSKIRHSCCQVLAVLMPHLKIFFKTKCCFFNCCFIKWRCVKWWSSPRRFSQPISLNYNHSNQWRRQVDHNNSVQFCKTIVPNRLSSPLTYVCHASTKVLF